MDLNTAADLTRWHRKYLNAFWCVVAISVVGETAGLAFVDDRYAYFLECILTPSALLIALLTAVEWFMPKLNKHQDYFMITVATAMSAIWVITLSPLDLLQATLLMPLLISIFYVKRRVVLYALGLNLSVYAAFLALSSEVRNSTTATEMILMVCLMGGVTMIAMACMTRGEEIIERLESLSAARQELFVQNVVMDKLMKTDALTGLYNHRTFHEYLDKLMELSEKHPFPLFLAIIDIDNFKCINDTFGHRSGDIVLRAVARIIEESLTPNDFAARYGGEEFALLLTVKTFDEAYGLVEQIRCSVAKLTHPELGDHAVTVSIGLHEYQTHEGKESLFGQADELLYQAKRRGKNQTAVLPAL